MKIPRPEYTTQGVEDKLKDLEYKNITGTDSEKELVAAISNKKPFVLGVIRDENLPLKDYHVKAFSSGNWIWKITVETKGQFIGMFCGVWLKECDELPVVFASPAAYEKIIDITKNKK